MQEVVIKLQDDVHYYGDLGRQYLSNSDIYSLLNNPKDFKVQTDRTKAMIEGSYMHALILEPDTVESRFKIVDASTRNTKVYKEVAEANDDCDILLLHEAENMKECADAITSNFELYDMIRRSGSVYEEPMIKELFGNMWKAKRDVGNSVTIDIKTTSDINAFKRSAFRYNYDSQAWVYEQMFGVPMMFLVVDKNTKQTGIFGCSDEFLERGKNKVIKATEIYNRFFGSNATDDINQFIIRDTL
jgi:hypothetical protein